MGMNTVCPGCGHSERSSNRRGAGIGSCPKCGTQMRAHTAGASHLPMQPQPQKLADGTPFVPDAAVPAASALGGRPTVRSTASGPAASGDDDGDAPPVPGSSRAGQLRDFAHQYLRHGLRPVPAWGAQANGECCCPRGARCPQPGKHPRSVHVGPGEHDYSWKPLACQTHEEVEQRFAENGQYAEANLMLAIPAGILVIDQDNDDGGRQAITQLADQHGELPETLAHRTPHGVHRIYRTPPGWTGRAWVGKDARNPVPAGVDLRVPGQILMAPPSRVPGPGGTASYGPATGTTVADLPAAYVTAWTPPQTPATQPRRALPVPPDRADVAPTYVHAKVTGIVADVAAHQPGGRNTALYTAALKVGSTLGAARTTPGAEHATAEWTDQAAEEALMEAAERNGYIAKDGAAAARSAIRSGLRNGLRNPRALPDFTDRRDPTPRAAAGTSARRGPGNHPPDARLPPATPGAQAHDADAGAGHDNSTQSGQASRREAPTASSVSAVLRAAGFVARSDARQAAHVPEGYQVQTAPDGGILIHHVAIDEPVNDVSPSARIERMHAGYAHALRAAGFPVTRRASGSLLVQPGPARQAAPAPEAARQAESRQTQASLAAAKANEAYRAREFDRARQLIDQAAELDPDRADLWQQHRSEIAAKRLFTQARQARAKGDARLAEKLLEDARQLDPRMQMLWNRHLTGVRSTQHAAASSDPAAARNDRIWRQPVRQPSREHGADLAAGSRWVERPGLGGAFETSGGSEAHDPQRLRVRTQLALPGKPDAGGRNLPPRNAEMRRQAAGPQPDKWEAQPATGSRVPARERVVSATSPGPRLSLDPEGWGMDAGDWRDALAEKQRREWQPKVAQPGAEHPRMPQAEAPDIGA